MIGVSGCFLVFFVAFSSAQMTVTDDLGCIIGEVDALTGSCPRDYAPITNGWCVAPKCIKTVPCADKTDSNGDSLCPITKLGCGKQFLKWEEEPTLCAKTCGYCSAPGTCVDLRGPDGTLCTGKAGYCNSSDVKIRDYTRKLCPKTCGLCP